MTKEVQVHGLDEIRSRMQAYPVVYARQVSKFIVTGMLVFHENVPAYPPKPQTSSYVRKGNLGRSLGIVSRDGQGSGAGGYGQASIFRIKRLGGLNFEGHFGTNTKYAPRVIGDRTQQTHPFNQYWWRLEQVIGPSWKKINQAANKLTDKLAKFLDGKGMGI